MRKIIMASITAVVVVAVLAGTLIPILDDATATTDTFTNDGYYRMSKQADWEIVWDMTDSSNLTTIEINGVAYSMASSIPNYASRSIAFSEDLVVRMFNMQPGVFSIQLWDSAYKIGVASSTFTGKLTITINNGTLTWYNSSTDTSTDYAYSGDMICIDPDGDMILKKSTDSSYLLRDSSIVFGGGISLLAGSTYSGIYITGTVEDYEVSVMNSNVTVSDKAAVYTTVSGYEGLISFEKLTFNTTYSDTTTQQTYSYIAVPYEVTAERSVHFTDGENAIFNAIPVIVIIALLLAVVAIVLRSRMD